MEHGPCTLFHFTIEMGRPNGHRKHHDVHGGKGRYGHTDQEVTAFLIDHRLGFAGIKWLGLIAEINHPLNNGTRINAIILPRDA